MHYQLPIPTNYGDFERLVRDWFKIKFGIDFLEMYARGGQRQFGIDTYGYFQGKLITIQSKNHQASKSTIDIQNEINNELKKFGNFKFKRQVDTYYFVTSYKNDNNLQNFALGLNLERLQKGESKFNLICWDTINDDLQDDKYSEVLRKYYQSFYNLQQEDKQLPVESKKAFRSEGSTTVIINNTQNIKIENSNINNSGNINFGVEINKTNLVPEIERSPLNIKAINRTSTLTNKKTSMAEIKNKLNYHLQCLGKNITTEGLIQDLKDNPALQITLFEIFLNNREYMNTIDKMINYVINPLIEDFINNKKLESDTANLSFWVEVQVLYATLLSKQLEK